MYKSTSRNMVSRAFRSALASSAKRLRVKVGGLTRSKIAAERAKKRKRDLLTESELVPMLGVGSAYAWTIFRRYRDKFSELGNDPKRCSAYLNVVAGARAKDGSLWSDKAIESIFRRAAYLRSRR